MSSIANVPGINSTADSSLLNNLVGTSMEGSSIDNNAKLKKLIGNFRNPVGQNGQVQKYYPGYLNTIESEGAHVRKSNSNSPRSFH